MRRTIRPRSAGRTATYGSSDLGANTPVITVSGWNVAQPNIPAPVP